MLRSIALLIAVLTSIVGSPMASGQGVGNFGRLPDPATYAPRGMGVIAPGKGQTFNGGSLQTRFGGTSIGNGSNWCAPTNCYPSNGNNCNDRWNNNCNWNNRCNSSVIVGYPLYGFGYGGYGGYYGSPSYYDPSYGQNQQIQDQNYLLRQEIDELRRQNDELKQQGQNPNVKVKVNVTKGRKTQDQIERDRRVVAQKRASTSTTTGSRLFNQGSYFRAADQFRQSIKHVDDDPTPHFYLAQALFAAGKFQEAAEAIKDGLQINPEWVDLEFDMRSLYKDPADVVTQMAALGKDLKENPFDRNALFVLGFELFVTGQKEKARTVFEQAARLESDDRHLKPFFDYFDAAEGNTPRMNADRRNPVVPPPKPKT